MIKVVCFDLDGVFFHKVHEKFIQALSEELGKTTGLIIEVFSRAVSEGGYNEMKLGQIDSNEYWEWLWKELGVEGKFDKDMYLAILGNQYEINSDALVLINELRNNNIKTAICSNNWPDNIRMLRERFDLSEYFDIEVYSFEVGTMKPDRRIFEELIEQSKCKPEEIFYSDDSEKMLVGARELGINTSIYTNFKKFKTDLKSLQN